MGRIPNIILAGMLGYLSYELLLRILLGSNGYREIVTYSDGVPFILSLSVCGVATAVGVVGHLRMQCMESGAAISALFVAIAWIAGCKYDGVENYTLWYGMLVFVSIEFAIAYVIITAEDWLWRTTHP